MVAPLLAKADRQDNALQNRDIMLPDHARNMAIIGHSDQGGRADGIQVMVENGFAYIGHLFSGGFSIVDVRDPSRPKAAGFIAAPPNTWNVHLQVADNLLGDPWQGRVRRRGLCR